MDRDRILALLREHAQELHAAGVKRLYVFGSVARGDANSHSDIDLMADFDRSKQVTLVTLGGLEQRLGALLGARVEISTADWMKNPVRERALREAVVAF
jgi:uncharacterized protein